MKYFFSWEEAILKKDPRCFFYVLGLGSFNKLFKNTSSTASSKRVFFIIN